MLFNSPAFLFAFLPLVLLGHFACAHMAGRRVALVWLVAASLAFYAARDLADLPLLVVSMAFNLAVARRVDAQAGRSRAAWLAFGIAADLALLVHFKYAAFFVATLAGAPGPALPAGLPLGISFFTFTQIAFLVDVHGRRAADLDPLRYALFVSYYPHLVAGPILHHAQTMPQFRRPEVFVFDAARVADGLAIVILGLFKKVVLADGFAGFANQAFDAAAGGQALTLYEAWGAALSFSLQIYFDFSGYCDMALGLAWMIGVRLPMNFDAPYRAGNIVEFWRRWHITLSSFLRDYVYIPLGGNRYGRLRRHLNLMLTMLLGGLWHGAAWTFIAWGAWHGVLLVLCHASRAGVRRLGWASPPALRRPVALVATGLTFVAVVIGWVLFRAADLPTAWRVLQGMGGLHGAVLPDQWLSAAPLLSLVARGAGQVSHLADGTVMGALEMLVMLGLGLAVVWWAPTIPNLSASARQALLVPCAALALQRVLFGPPSPFLYFQF